MHSVDNSTSDILIGVALMVALMGLTAVRSVYTRRRARRRDVQGRIDA